jgi:hypothetical protein
MLVLFYLRHKIGDKKTVSYFNFLRSVTHLRL